jgi:hypothetical protein
MVMSVITGVTIALGYGGSTAASAGDGGAAAALKDQSLAGRWTGHSYGYGRQAGGDCGDDGCNLTYDIVACKDGWCGIRVTDGKTCGAVGLHLAVNTSPQPGAGFKGKLELAKGSAPYTVGAWYDASEDGGPHLHFLGDTGPELILMRRSFPFEADLARTGDPVCKLDKATS